MTQVVRDLGADPVMILPVVDRGGTCGALALEANIEFRPLVTAVDLGFPYEVLSKFIFTTQLFVPSFLR